MTSHRPKAIVIVTGAGLKPATVFFKEGMPATLIKHAGSPHKMNAAAGVASVLNGDYFLCVTGYRQDHLDTLSSSQLGNPHMTRVVDLKDKAATAAFAAEVAGLKNWNFSSRHWRPWGMPIPRTPSPSFRRRLSAPPPRSCSAHGRISANSASCPTGNILS